MPDIARCLACDRETYASLTVCPHCGATMGSSVIPKKRTDPRKWTRWKVEIIDNDILVWHKKHKAFFRRIFYFLIIFIFLYYFFHLSELFGIWMVSILILYWLAVTPAWLSSVSSRRPVLVIRPEGITVPQFSEPIRWEWIGDILKHRDKVRITFKRPIVANASASGKMFGFPSGPQPHADLRLRGVETLALHDLVGEQRELWLRHPSKPMPEEEEALLAAQAKHERRDKRQIILAFLAISVLYGGNAIADSYWREFKDRSLSAALDAYDADDYSSAVTVFRQLASVRDPSAEFFLGEVYQYGRGVDQSIEEAVRWYRRAESRALGPKSFGTERRRSDCADRRAVHQGQAMYRLGLFHEHGQGVAKDISEAHGYYWDASVQCHNGAALRLGRMRLADGYDAKNVDAAVTLFRRAAKRREAEAMYALGTIYVAPELGRVDRIEAQKWFILAARFGGVDASVENWAESNLSKAEQIEAKRRANDWMSEQIFGDS